MRKLIFIVFLFISTLINAQKLLFDKSEPELNSNTSLDFSYTELVTGDNSDFEGGTVGNWAHASVVASVDSGYNSTYSLVFRSTDGSSDRIELAVSGLTIGLVYEYRVWLKDNNPRGFMLNWTFGTITSVDIASSWTEYTQKFIATATSGVVKIYSSNVGGGVTDSVWIDNFTIKGLISPTNFITPTMTATDYVIEDSGCKFVEVTGETYIQMNDTLDAGYYKLKIMQNWQQGQVWAFNGTTTYNFPQADGEYIVKIYLPGNKPLVIGCDNNTISVLSSLSIK